MSSNSTRFGPGAELGARNGPILALDLISVKLLMKSYSYEEKLEMPRG
jgi:hypothetical protein